MADTAPYEQLSEQQLAQVQGLLSAFGEGWTPHSWQDLPQRLAGMPSPVREHAWKECVKADLARQWAAGNPQQLETYLIAFPELGTPESVAAELVIAEWQARKQAGQPPSLEAFSARFPQQVAVIRKKQAARAQKSVHQPAQVTLSPHSPAQSTLMPSRIEAARSEPSLIASKGRTLPKQFGKFQLIRKLGGGGMGDVLLAEDVQLNRQVAIKVPKINVADGDQILKRFFAEARAIAKLAHNNICKIFDIGEFENTPYLVMEFVDGVELADVIKSANESNRPIPISVAISIVRKIALALQYSHDNGVVHRDLKPANIMLEKSRREPIVMDFGLASLGQTGDARLTQTGMIMGTLMYMPPEQIDGDPSRVGPLCDVYSLTAVLYELLTGKAPFVGSMTQLVAQIVTQQPAPPSKHRAEIPPQLDAICLRGLAKSPEHRFASMQELATALSEYTRESKLSKPASAEETQGLTTFVNLVNIAARPKLTDLAPATLIYRARSIRRKWGALLALATVALAGLVCVAILASLFSNPASTDGTVEFELSDSQANVELLIDGTLRVTDARLPLKISSGRHEVIVVNPDIEAQSQEFQVAAGKTSVVRLTLIPKSQTTTNTAPTVAPSPADVTAARPPPTAGAGLPTQFISGGWKTINVLQHLETSRDAIAGNWILSDKILRQSGWTHASRIELPVDNLPAEYSLSITGVRIPVNADNHRTLSLILPIGGKNALVYLDENRFHGGGKQPLSGVFLADDWSPDTVVTGLQLPDDKRFSIRVIVKQRELSVFIDGRKLFQWTGDPQLLSLPAHMAARMPGRIAIGAANDYSFSQIHVAPLQLPPNTNLDLMTAVDYIDGTMVGSEYDHVFWLPVEPPEKYKLSIEAVRVKNRSLPFRMELISQGNPFSVLLGLKNSLGGGLELIDGKAAAENATTIFPNVIKDDRPFIAEVHVDRRRVQLNVDGKRVIDWEGAADRLSRGDAIQDLHPHDFFVGGGDSYRILKASLRSPTLVNQPIARANSSVVDLLALIDPQRDSVVGTFQKSAAGLSMPASSNSARIGIPYEFPEEYQLRAELVAPRFVEGLYFALPTTAGHARCVLNAGGGQSGGLNMHHESWEKTSTASTGIRVAPGGSFADLVITVRRTGIRVESDGKVLIDWTGDLRRVNVPTAGIMARNLGIESFNTTYQFRRLELHPLPSPTVDFPPVATIDSTGNLLRLIDPQRDTFWDGKWEWQNGDLLSHAFGESRWKFLNVPCVCPDEYEVRAQLRRTTSQIDGFNLIVPIGSSRAQFVIDGFLGPYTGIHTIDGILLSQQTSNRHHGELLKSGSTHEVICSVRRAGAQYRLILTVDGVTISDWTGFASQVANQGERTAPFASARGIVLLCSSPFAISKLELRDPASESQATTNTAPADTTPAPPLVNGAEPANPLNVIDAADEVAVARKQLLDQGGGNAASEAAVAAALEWLANHQMPDGGWNYDHRSGACQSRCDKAGNLTDCRTGATAQALLPFLGADQTHKKGKYKKQVEAGLFFLTQQMDVKTQAGLQCGDLGQGGGSMYAHGLATIVLCEAYAKTLDKGLKMPAQLALNHIVYAQDPTGGGWRYAPRTPGDTSVSGWQLLALKSGHLGKLQVPPTTIVKANKFLDSVMTDYAYYGYTDPGKGQATTAIGVLNRMYLGWKRDHPGIEKGIRYLGETGPSAGNLYYNYYATDCMFHYGGDPWSRWNAKMRDQIVNSQDHLGHMKGSWSTRGDHGMERGGRLYCTSMATLILEVYYRHKPIYPRADP